MKEWLGRVAEASVLVHGFRAIHQEVRAGIEIQCCQESLRLLRVLVHIDVDSVLVTLHLDIDVQVATAKFRSQLFRLIDRFHF